MFNRFDNWSTLIESLNDDVGRYGDLVCLDGKLLQTGFIAVSTQEESDIATFFKFIIV